MAREEEEETPKKKRKKGKRFWTTARVLMLFIFLIGLVVGGFLTHQFLEPILSGDLQQQLDDCNTFRSALDEQFESCRECMESFNINPATCTRS